MVTLQILVHVWQPMSERDGYLLSSWWLLVTTVTRSSAKEGSSEVVTDATLIFVVPGRVPAKRRTRTPAVKKVKSSCVSSSVTPSSSLSISTNKTKSNDPIEFMHTVKKPHTMTSLYTDPIKIPDVIHNIATSECNHIVPNVVSSIGTFEKPVSDSRSLDNPKSDKTLSQTNIVDNLVDADVNKLPSKSLVGDPVSDVSKTIDDPIVEALKKTVTHSNVASDVMTSLAQPEAHVETTQDNPHIESESESASDSKNSQSKIATDDGEDQKVYGNEDEKSVSGDDENSGLEK